MEGKEASTQEEEKEASMQEEELCKAAREGDCRKVKELVDSGADVTYFDSNGFTPLMHAAKQGHCEVVECLLKSGAPWNALHPSGSCAGDFAMEAGHQDTFDLLLNAGIFFDTYGEYYEDMKEFHQYLPKLLKGEGIYSFFNGLCADNAFFHVVYCQLVALELANIGYTTQFIPLPVKDCLEEKAWEGIKRKYWQLDTYYLPVCQASSE